jgi:hypothetical protein
MPTTAENLKIAMETFLDLPDIEIQDVSEDRDGNDMITAISTKAGTECHKCGNRIEKAYGYKRMDNVATFAGIWKRSVYSHALARISVHPLRWQPDDDTRHGVVRAQEQSYQGI